MKNLIIPNQMFDKNTIILKIQNQFCYFNLITFLKIDDEKKLFYQDNNFDNFVIRKEMKLQRERILHFTYKKRLLKISHVISNLKNHFKSENISEIISSDEENELIEQVDKYKISETINFSMKNKNLISNFRKKKSEKNKIDYLQTKNKIMTKKYKYLSHYLDQVKNISNNEYPLRHYVYLSSHFSNFDKKNTKKRRENFGSKEIENKFNELFSKNSFLIDSFFLENKRINLINFLEEKKDWIKDLFFFNIKKNRKFSLKYKKKKTKISPKKQKNNIFDRKMFENMIKDEKIQQICKFLKSKNLRVRLKNIFLTINFCQETISINNLRTKRNFKMKIPKIIIVKIVNIFSEFHQRGYKMFEKFLFIWIIKKFNLFNFQINIQSKYLSNIFTKMEKNNIIENKKNKSKISEKKIFDFFKNNLFLNIFIKKVKYFLKMNHFKSKYFTKKETRTFFEFDFVKESSRFQIYKFFCNLNDIKYWLGIFDCESLFQNKKILLGYLNDISKYFKLRRKKIYKEIVMQIPENLSVAKLVEIYVFDLFKMKFLHSKEKISQNNFEFSILKFKNKKKEYFLRNTRNQKNYKNTKVNKFWLENTIDECEIIIQKIKKVNKKFLIITVYKHRKLKKYGVDIYCCRTCITYLNYIYVSDLEEALSSMNELNKDKSKVELIQKLSNNINFREINIFQNKKISIKKQEKQLWEFLLDSLVVNEENGDRFSFYTIKLVFKILLNKILVTDNIFENHFWLETYFSLESLNMNNSIFISKYDFDKYFFGTKMNFFENCYNTIIDRLNLKSAIQIYNFTFQDKKIEKDYLNIKDLIELANFINFSIKAFMIKKYKFSRKEMTSIPESIYQIELIKFMTKKIKEPEKNEFLINAFSFLEKFFHLSKKKNFKIIKSLKKSQTIKTQKKIKTFKRAFQTGKLKNLVKEKMFLTTKFTKNKPKLIKPKTKLVKLKSEIEVSESENSILEKKNSIIDQSKIESSFIFENKNLTYDTNSIFILNLSKIDNELDNCLGNKKSQSKNNMKQILQKENMDFLIDNQKKLFSSKMVTSCVLEDSEIKKNKQIRIKRDKKKNLIKFQKNNKKINNDEIKNSKICFYRDLINGSNMKLIFTQIFDKKKLIIIKVFLNNEEKFSKLIIYDSQKMILFEKKLSLMELSFKIPFINLLIRNELHIQLGERIIAVCKQFCDQIIQKF